MRYYPNWDYITCEINKERSNNGLSELLISTPGCDVAGKHAQDMARIGRLTFVGSDGRDLRTRLNDAAMFSSLIIEFVFSGYNHDGYFADMATDSHPDNDFYKALMNRDVVAVAGGYQDMYWDVNLLGAHRRLVTRPASCPKPAGAE